MANRKWSSRTSGFETAVWAAKLAFSFLGMISFGAVARAVVPAAAEVLASALPGSWRSLRSWTAPPYLFIAVHFIILVIWKLSDPKQQQRHQHEGWSAAEERTMEQGNPMNVKFFEPSPAARLLRRPSPEIWRNEKPKSPMTEAVPAANRPESFPDESHTAESSEGSTTSPAVVVKKSAVPESKSSIAVAEKEDEESAPPPPPVTKRIKNASMEATWKVVAEKSSSQEEPPPAEAALQSASHDEEMNRRFEDFIKMNHEQIRLPVNRRRQFVIENTTSSQ